MYNDSTKLLSLEFNFSDSNTEVGVFLNYNKVMTENYAISPGDSTSLDLSALANGAYWVEY